MYGDLPSWSNDYIGIPYEPMGRTRDGLDCWGLLRLVYREQFAIDVPSYTEDYASPEEHEEVGRLIRSETTRSWKRVDYPGLGDGCLFDVYGEPAHVGVVVWPGIMLHIRRGTGSCVERYDNPTWRPRLMGFYQHPDRA